MIPGPEKPTAVFRPGRMAGFAAAALSVALHGALAATVVFWPSDPVPYPIADSIMVELISIAPEPGAGASPEVEISAAPEPSSEPSGEALEETPEEVQEEAPEDVSTEEPEAVEEPEVVEQPEAVEEPEAVFAPHPVFEVSPRRPIREAPPQVAKVSPTPVQSPIPSPLPTEATGGTQTASLHERRPDQEGNPGVGGGDPGGLFVGPGFRLGTARNPLPRYPRIARRRGLEGRVIVRVLVGVDGIAQSVRIAQSSAHTALDAAALKALLKWRFEPAKRAGIPVAASVNVPIAFRLHD